jgi:Predicted amidophosphoribosyltransferases
MSSLLELLNQKIVSDQSPSRFRIIKNNFLAKDIVAYYNRPYTGYGHEGNPNFLNTLKNTFDNESLSRLRSARQEVESILLDDLPNIINRHNFQNCICVCIPRAKSLNTYTDNQLFLRDAVSNVANKISGLVDGTDVVIRHTNTFTTHLEKATLDGRISNNDGAKPYPGITKATSYIKKDKIIGKRIILIDDIYTKGVNIDEDCIQALLDNGAQEVIFYAIGRTGGN